MVAELVRRRAPDQAGRRYGLEVNSVLALQRQFGARAPNRDLRQLDSPANYLDVGFSSQGTCRLVHRERERPTLSVFAASTPAVPLSAIVLHDNVDGWLAEWFGLTNRQWHCLGPL